MTGSSFISRAVEEYEGQYPLVWLTDQHDLADPPEKVPQFETILQNIYQACFVMKNASIASTLFEQRKLPLLTEAEAGTDAPKYSVSPRRCARFWYLGAHVACQTNQREAAIGYLNLALGHIADDDAAARIAVKRFQ